MQKYTKVDPEEDYKEVKEEETPDSEEKKGVHINVDVNIPQLATSVLTAIGAHKLMSGIEKTALANSDVGIVGTAGLAVLHTLTVITAASKGWHVGEVFKKFGDEDEEKEEAPQDEDE